MSQDRPVANLPIAYAELNRYIGSAVFNELNKKEKDSVLLLSNQLKTLFAQGGWLRQGGLIADYHAKVDGEETKSDVPIITQEDLIEELEEVDKITRQFTLQILEKMMVEINKLLPNQLPIHLQKLLEKIKSCIENTVDDTKKQAGLSDHNQKYFMQLAQKLNIAFIPSEQAMDPLHQDSHGGHCFGHVTMWSQAAASNQINYSRLFRVNPESYQYQKKAFLTQDCIFEYSPKKTIRTAVQDLISYITNNPNSIFNLSFKPMFNMRFDVNRLGHITGIRCTSPHGYEFFDPNFGTFVFEKAFQFEKWLVVLMRFYLINNIAKNTENVCLAQRGIQYQYAKPSIPKIDFSPFDVQQNFIKGSKIYLMSSPTDSYETSNMNNLYLYYEKESFFYHFQVNNNTYKFALPHSELLNDLLKNQPFDQKGTQLKRCKNKLFCQSILRITSERGHSFLNDMTSLKELASKSIEERRDIFEANSSVLLLNENFAQEAIYNTKQIELYRYFYHAETEWKNDIENKIIESIHRENIQLKKIVIEKIRSEIKRLEEKWFGNNIEIIAALNELLKNIDKASPILTLSVIVNQWLEMNRNKISGTDTRFVINELEEHNEISPYYLNFVRAEMVQMLKKVIFHAEWIPLGGGQNPELIELLQQTFNYFEQGDLTLRELLIQLRDLSAKEIDKKSIPLNQLNAILKQIKPDDTFWMRLHRENLVNLNNSALYKPVSKETNTPKLPGI